MSEARRVIVAGGTGFIGKKLIDGLQQEGFQVVILTRGASREGNGVKYVHWDAEHVEDEWAKEVDGARAVINLAGRGVMDKRWTAAFKSELENSRILSTRAIGEAIKASKAKPQVWINASGIAIYGDTKGNEVDESAPKAAQSDFLGDLTVAWEAEAFRLKEDAEACRGNGTRIITARIGAVLDKAGGLVKALMLPFWLHFGGHIGDGKQYVPWVAMDDVVRGFIFLIENSRVEGVVNFTAPAATTLAELCTALGRVMNRWSWCHVPVFVVKLAMGEMGALATMSQRVNPKVLLDAGFIFSHSTIDSALTSALK